MQLGCSTPKNSVDWEKVLTSEEWEVYRRVICETRARGVQFALGGAFALATYTGDLRKTKDLDLYVLPQDREAMVDLTTECGLEDYYDKLAYDRGWIYRSYTADVIVDVIWGMANRRAEVDCRWLTGGPEVEIRGERLKIVPAEELIWGKLYVMQRERCDWPDILNLLYEAGPSLDWAHLLGRLRDDAPLLGSVLSLFAWLCPARMRSFPDWLPRDERICFPRIDAPGAIHDRRVKLLDSRPWFKHSEKELCC
jgi:hypothetical protein